MIDMTELRKIFADKLVSTNNLDDALIKVCWVAFIKGVESAKDKPK